MGADESLVEDGPGQALESECLHGALSEAARAAASWAAGGHWDLGMQEQSSEMEEFLDEFPCDKAGRVAVDRLLGEIAASRQRLRMRMDRPPPWVPEACQRIASGSQRLEVDLEMTLEQWRCIVSGLAALAMMMQELDEVGPAARNARGEMK